MSHSTSSAAQTACGLEDVIATEQLDLRPIRISDSDVETQALLTLVRELARTPGNFFAKLIEAARQLSGADSTGISLLDEETKRFVWPAVSGTLKSYIGSGTPRDFGPCGTVLDRQSAILFLHPERHFTYLASISPPLEEVLLIPFYMDRKPVGTIWAVIHDKDRKFDSEHRSLLTSLSNFAADAYRILASNGTLKPLLKTKMSG
ncbi:MAG TPA: GAF domain-containing protein [Verrucomicrobiae bacterium]|jgi:GAF domain-containing protein|nr:GAF domain-containing protein [Verrucomicrobiae bacterium]